MRVIYFAMLIMIVPFSVSIAQTTVIKNNDSYPRVGELFPEYKFTELINYPRKSANISEFRGKWLILDVWGYSCTGCILSFPRMDTLASRFKESVQVIMVGATKSAFGQGKKIEQRTKDIYRHLEKAYDLKVTVAFDSIFYPKFNVAALPQIYLIDPDGVIRAKTTHIDSAQLSAILKGHVVSFERSFSKGETVLDDYDPNLPVLTTGKMANGGSDTSFAFRSMLKVWNESLPRFMIANVNQDGFLSHGRIELFEYDITNLYRFACFGVNDWEIWDTTYSNHKYPTLINELKDSSTFNSHNNEKFVYSLSFSKKLGSKKKVLNLIKTELDNYFDFQSSVERRAVPVYYFSVVDAERVEKLKSKTTNFKSSSSYDGKSFRHVSIDQFSKHLAGWLHLKIPVICRTNNDDIIDIDFKANMLDPDEIVKNLAKYGFKLEKGLKEMDVIVIKNRPTSNDSD